jgi:PTS system mannose-specific IIA component
MAESKPRPPALLVVSHGNLSEVLLAAARGLEGDIPDAEAIALGDQEDVASASRRIEEAIARLRARCGSVVVLTDMFGGTASDLSLTHHEPGTVEVVTGANLPMVVKFHHFRLQYAFPETVRRIAEHGRASIQVASELLRRSDAGGEG